MVNGFSAFFQNLQKDVKRWTKSEKTAAKSWVYKMVFQFSNGSFHEYRDTLVNFFQNTVNNPDDWNTELYPISRGFLACLQEF
jgi:hypothetical protein